ncbi:MAG TPA: helix-turn-helix domain-containing protein [Polyangia bacterium]|jgi:AcrR family transcriptional regulator|nr:helix-turn-helix domain-containing protein [Polyangia bacterium]
MARPITISDERILDAARAVFLEHGVAATTADVAKRAGVAEGSIFKRFATKIDLFKAAMQVDFDTLDFLHTLVAATDEDDPRLTLQRFGLDAVIFFRRLMPLVMLQFGTGKKLGIPDALIGPDAPPLRALKTLAAYFERQMKSGRMRKHNPETVARMLLGSIQSYVFFEILLRAQQQMPLPVATYLRGLIEVLWTGVQPAPRKGH